MRANDATTIWEMWEKNLPGHSMLHSSFLYPAAWFIEGLVGIKPATPGFSTFIVQPPVAGSVGVSWAAASYQSASGTIQVKWNRPQPAGRLSLEISVPPNTTGLLKLSDTDQSIIGNQDPRVRPLQRDGKFQVYELQPGVYHF